jgi:mono/diheme cytochrome c family protein
MSTSRTVFSLAATVVSVLVFGCGDENSGPPSSKPVSSASPPVAEWVLEPPASVVSQLSAGGNENQGLALYRHYCSVCHGPEGKGDGQFYPDSLHVKPTDFTDPQAVDAMSQQHVAKVIREGSAAIGKSSLCPPWGRVLSDNQVTALADHVHELSNAQTTP